MSPSRRRLAVLLAPLAGLALVAVPLPGAAAAGSVTLTPEPQGDLATRQGRSVTVDGQVPAGALGARLVAVTTAGDEVVQEYTSGTIGQPDGAQYLRNDAGHLVGRLPIGCPFGPEDLCGPHAPVTGVRLDVTVDGAPFPSGVLPVDYDRPEITRYLLVAPDRIQVRFDEPVRGDDSALDWTVQDPDAVVSQVEAPAGDCTSLPDGDYRRSRSGCTRVLVLARPLSEDATPLVTYAPALNRPLYDDDASNRVNRDSETTATTSRALDGVPPAVPSIDAIDGRAPAGTPPTVAGRATAPAVVVGGLTPGHRVEVSAKRDAAASSDGLVVATAAGSTQEVTLKDLASAGQVASYDVRAVAVDPSGNRSAGDGVRNPARYQLDAQPPMLLGADSRDGSSITVTFSEPVLPDGGAPADWEVKDPAGTAIPVTGVSGTGAERRLTPTAPAGSTVTYMGTRYADAVGNPLPTTSVPLAAVAVPLVRTPTTTTYVTTSSVGVTGTSGAGRLEVYRDTNADGVPDGAALLTPPTSGGEFAVAAPLPADGIYDLLVLLVADKGRSPVARVPRVVRDTTPPAVDLTAPAGGEKAAGGSTQTARYTHSDANGDLVRLELSLGDTAPYTVLSVAPATTNGSLTQAFVLPKVDTDQARLRAVAIDKAGNATARTSQPFTIDATPPRLAARTVDARTVVVRLSEAVTGSSSALDWQVKGQRASQATQTTEGGRQVVRLTTAPGVTIGPDEEPQVVYEPTGLSTPYRDRVGFPVANPRTTALDGILPAAPTVTAPVQPVLTKEATQTVTGRGTAADRVELLDPFGSRVAGPVAVAPDGTWTLDAPLPRDAVTDLRARALDAHDNASTAVPVARIEQDGTDPAVTVTEPQAGTRVEPGQQVAVRWSSTDTNLVDGATLVEASTDGGTTFTTVAEQQPASGSLTWTAPDTVTPRALLRVSTPDRAGRTGRGSSGLFGIGTAASSPSPSATASASPSATASPLPSVPPVGPVTVSVPPGSIVPGQTADVVVSGDPGTRVELQAYSRPVTQYSRVRTGTLGPDGRLVLPIRPGTNTRLYAKPVGGDTSTHSRSAVVNVRTALSLTVVRNGRRDYTFQGRILPRRSGQLITLYRVTAEGRRVITTQIRTDDTGTYRIRRVFTGSGRFGFLTRTGQTLTNAAGESNEGKARPTDVF